MVITNIRESGTSNVLKWAISNGADIKSDIQLQSIINDETFYLMTIKDVNFLELFRLTQMFREKVRVIEEKKADVPIRKELREMFQGDFVEDPENEPDKKVPLHELVEYSAQTFLNLAMQMNADSDIIRPETVRLFIPMLCRRFDVQIPVGFLDFISGIRTSEEAARIFTTDYPNTLISEVVEAEESNVRNMLYLNLMKATSIIRLDQRYDQLVKMTKYTPLRKAPAGNLYKFRMTGFFKYDNISRGETRCSMFHPNKSEMAQAMKKLSHLTTPLKVEFVVQLPIQYMQLILNAFSREELGITYESSMSSIIDGGIEFHDFVTHNYDENSEDPDEQAKITEYNNSIEAYQTRITEANQAVLSTIPILINNPTDVDITGAFSLLPAIYSTKAIFTLNMDHIQKYASHFDPTIATMFQEMIAVCQSLQEDINRNR